MFMQLVEGDLFARFPTLRLAIPHGGGAVPCHWGRFRGLADRLGLPQLSEHVMGNVFFDTRVHHQAGIDLLVRVIDVRNVVFASEMIGAVRGVDPENGHHWMTRSGTSRRPALPTRTGGPSSRRTRCGSIRGWPGTPSDHPQMDLPEPTRPPGDRAGDPS